MNYYVDVLKKYAVFSGRAGRKEYWMFFLYNIVISIILGIVAAVISGGSKNVISAVNDVYSLAVLLPTLAVWFRRLHDTNRSGWWIFINLIPVIGQIIMIVFLVQKTKQGDNKYGPAPVVAQ